MNIYEITPGLVRPGIPLARDGTSIEVGEDGRGRALVRLPIPASAVREYGRVMNLLVREDLHRAAGALVLVRNHSGYRGSWRAAAALTVAERVTQRAIRARHITALARGDVAGEEAFTVGDARGAAYEESRLTSEAAKAAACEGHIFEGWGAPCPACPPTTADTPAPWRVIAEGRCAEGIAGGMGGGPEFLAVLGAGQMVDLIRSGRLYGRPAVWRLEIGTDGAPTLTDCAAEAASTEATAAL